MFYRFVALLLLLGSMIVRSAAADGKAVPSALRCEYRVDPIGIDDPRPRLFWTLDAADPAARGIAQTGYQVRVATSRDRLATGGADLWDSGRVASTDSTQLPYAGIPLTSGQTPWWTVRVWDQAGDVSDWAPPARWTTGILESAGWHDARWIAGRPGDETVLLRRVFSVRPGLVRATANVCGLGQYQMTIDGHKVGDAALSPGWTLYSKTCLYDTIDLTSSVRPGPNAVGLLLGNGFYNIHKGRYTKITGSFGPLKSIAVIRLDYADGSTQYVTTDADWKTAPGPIVFSSVYGGEDYDARLACRGWDSASYDDSSWSSAVVTTGPGGTLKGLCHAGPPVKTFETVTPVSVRRLDPATAVYDLGRNLSVVPRIRVRGPAGSSVRITPSELVHDNGDIDDAMCGGQSYCTYTLEGSGDETYEPKFYYRGGRYLKVQTKPATNRGPVPEVLSVDAVFVHADAPPAGEFSCSNERYNKIYAIVRAAQVNNTMSVMTDCPTREKLGWLEEDHLNGPALRFNFGLSTLMAKLVDDMADSQRASGLVPSTCPDFPHWKDDDMYVTPPEWGSACVAVPWQQYRFDGDVKILADHYDTMKRYVDYLRSKSAGHLISFGLGDWYDGQHSGPSRLTPIGLTATAFFYFDTATLGRIARLLNKPDEATEYEHEADRIKSAFNAKYFDRATGNYATGSQSSNAFPLAMGMVDDADRPAVLRNLVADVTTKGETAGEVGLDFLIRALADGGRSDVLDKIFDVETSGYGLQIKQGKTSLTEGWNGGDSQDHFMFGQINEWFFHDLAGIGDDPASPGFKHFFIRPAFLKTLDHVEASYESAHGRIVSQWHRDGGDVVLHVVVPANTTATVRLPAEVQSVTESDHPAGQSPGVTPIGEEFAIASGQYTFRAKTRQHD